MLLAICPPTWNKASGAVVPIIALVGNLKPPDRPGIVRNGVNFARSDKVMHHDDTKPNCTIVSVTGWGNELRIVFEEVFDSADERYLQIPGDFLLA